MRGAARCPPLLPLPVAPLTHVCLKRRPSAEPWLHLTAAVVGVYLGGKLGNLYDDVNVVVEKQLRDSTIVPTWAYGTLSPAELDAQLKRQRLADMHQKFATLAEAEEKEYQKNKPVHTGAPHKLFQ